VKEAYEAAAGYKESFIEIVADLYAEGETVVPDKYSVTFLGLNDKWITTVIVDAGDAAVAPEIPEIAGYEFVKWDKDFSVITDNIEVRALYKKVGDAIEIVVADQKKEQAGKARKIMHNGQLFIIRDGKIYTITGQQTR